MKLQELKKLISEEVRKAITEASEEPVPTSTPVGIKKQISQLLEAAIEDAMNDLGVDEIYVSKLSYYFEDQSKKSDTLKKLQSLYARSYNRTGLYNLTSNNRIWGSSKFANWILDTKFTVRKQGGKYIVSR
jgi:hypothetical protein